MIIPSGKTSELSIDYNYLTIIDHDSEDYNYNRPIPVSNDITPVWVLNVIV